MTALATKISKAAQDVGGKLKADKKNKEQNYDYISADKILSICGQALFDQGIAILPSINQHGCSIYDYTDNYGKNKRRYDVTVQFEIVVTDGEQSQLMSWFGYGSDYSVPDKAFYKAVTSGHKYFIMKLLCIGEGNEDGEHEAAEERKPEQTPQAPAPAPTAPAQPAEKPTNGNGNGSNGNSKVVEWLIQSKLAADDFSAKGMLNLFGEPIETADQKKIFMAWARLYRAHRDAGRASKEAAELAHHGYPVEE